MSRATAGFRAEAKGRRVSVAQVIRDAIDQALPAAPSKRAAAAAVVLGADRIVAPSVGELRAERKAAHERR